MENERPDQADTTEVLQLRLVGQDEDGNDLHELQDDASGQSQDKER